VNSNNISNKRACLLKEEIKTSTKFVLPNTFRFRVMIKTAETVGPLSSDYADLGMLIFTF